MTPEQRVELARAAIEYAEAHLDSKSGPNWSATPTGYTAWGPAAFRESPSDGEIGRAALAGEDVSPMVRQRKENDARLSEPEEANRKMAARLDAAKKRYIEARRSAGLPEVQR